jgi:hypothetical protein
MISDDELLLYYYRDGLDAAERARIGAALSEQPELAQRLHRLVARLDAAAALPNVPVPARTQRRWEVALDHAARGDPRRAATAGARLLKSARWPAAAAAIVVLAIVLTNQMMTRLAPMQATTESPSPATTHAAAPLSEASSYERGLRWHLASMEQRLASLDSAKPDERARLIETIVAQNRMYALAAERADEPQLARVLRAFTPILETLAGDREELFESDIAQLTFELRVMQARLSAETNPPVKARPVAL